MRKICIFNQFNDTKVMLNSFARLARKKKKVLYIDLRKTEQKNKISNILNEDTNMLDFVVTLEPNLDYIQGDHKMNLHEFGSYYKIFDLKYFDTLNSVDYDYVVIEVNDVLSVLANNALFFANEIIAVPNMNENGTEFIHKLARFTHQYNKIYGKNIFISNVIPVFSDKIDRVKHDYLISEFNSDLIAESVSLKEFEKYFDKIAISVVNVEKQFVNLNNKEKQKFIQEYLSYIQVK
ncbi:MAG: ParA family protein [Candidatus Woesearchaeota archaeon]